MVNPSIFKSYDIRGIYPSELNEEAAFDIGRSFINYTGAKSVVLGRDARISSPALSIALARGVLAEGGKVYDIGQAPTECLYFATGSRDFDGGIMITASHNPKEYNGFKMLKKGSAGLNVVRGKDMLSAVEQLEPAKDSAEEKEVSKEDIWKDFVNHILSFVDLSEIVPLKIVVDASNGVAGLVVSKIQESLPVEIVALNFEPNGNFPNHSPNPLEPGSADKIGETVKNEKADFGVIFDGDADRIFLVDENGKLVRADATLLLLAKYFLEKNPGMAVAYNAICSKAVPEFIGKWGGKPVRTKVGFVNVRECLLKNNGIMGGELSGHYCFKDNFYMDSGMISFLILLQVISKDGRNVSEIIKELVPYPKSPELNFEVEDSIRNPSASNGASKDAKQIILEKIKEKYADPSTSLGVGGKADFLDGITVTYKDWWFNVRPSNTEPLLRLTIEADTQELLEEKQKELKGAIIE